MNEADTDGLREEAKNRVGHCAANLDEKDPDGSRKLERAIEIAKVEALVSISGELELIRKHLQRHGLQPEFKTSD
ncbi:hypothetical protein ONA92_02095 [Mycobacteroides salmoniphilum]|uniref:hypothetical protein n=1 Tax=Mycobacteroides salmoniphilum TaxID=404941 RepID=UPI00356489D0